MATEIDTVDDKTMSDVDYTDESNQLLLQLSPDTPTDSSRVRGGGRYLTSHIVSNQELCKELLEHSLKKRRMASDFTFGDTKFAMDLTNRLAEKIKPVQPPAGNLNVASPSKYLVGEEQVAEVANQQINSLPKSPKKPCVGQKRKHDINEIYAIIQARKVGMNVEDIQQQESIDSVDKGNTEAKQNGIDMPPPSDATDVKVENVSVKKEKPRKKREMDMLFIDEGAINMLFETGGPNAKSRRRSQMQKPSTKTGPKSVKKPVAQPVKLDIKAKMLQAAADTLKKADMQESSLTNGPTVAEKRHRKRTTSESSASSVSSFSHQGGVVPAAASRIIRRRSSSSSSGSPSPNRLQSKETKKSKKTDAKTTQKSVGSKKATIPVKTRRTLRSSPTKTENKSAEKKKVVKIPASKIQKKKELKIKQVVAQKKKNAIKVKIRSESKKNQKTVKAKNNQKLTKQSKVSQKGTKKTKKQIPPKVLKAKDSPKRSVKVESSQKKLVKDAKKTTVKMAVKKHVGEKQTAAQKKMKSDTVATSKKNKVVKAGKNEKKIKADADSGLLVLKMNDHSQEFNSSLSQTSSTSENHHPRLGDIPVIRTYSPKKRSMLDDLKKKQQEASSGTMEHKSVVIMEHENGGSATLLSNDFSKDPHSPTANSYSSLIRKLEVDKGKRRVVDSEEISKQRSSIRQSEGVFHYKEICLRRYKNFVQIILNPGLTTMKNSFSIQVLKELTGALLSLQKDNNCSLVVLTAASNVFCQGIDVASLLHTTLEMKKKAADEMSKALKEFIRTLTHFNKLTIAGVNGPAVGLGVTMLPLFDLVFASDKATFSVPYSKLSQVPEGGSTYTFPQVLGTTVSSDMLFNGRVLTASEAQKHGLVTSVLWPSRFMEELIPRVSAVAEQVSQATEATKASAS